MFVFGDLQPRVERLVGQPPAAIFRVRIGAVCIGQEPQAVVEERPSAGVLFVVLGDALLDVGEAGADAVLVPFERREVDGVGEVRGQELVALGLQPCPVRGEVFELLIPPG